MTLLIVGATGTLGRQVTRRALDQGYEVRCLVRSQKRAAFLKEWGAQLVSGNLLDPETLDDALEGVTAVIDAATARATDSLSNKKIDWEGKLNLVAAMQRASIDRYVFFSILDSEKFPDVPLMNIKCCFEKYLAESDLKYTILRPAGFMQGLIGQYAIPILEGQSVWLTGQTAPIAFMDTIDIAKFAVRALEVSDTERQSFPVVGTRAWGAQDIIKLCERCSDKTAKVTTVPLGLVRGLGKFLRFFQWSWNIADRLAFTEVMATGRELNASMDEVYQTFDLDVGEMSTLEDYMQEYFSRILKKLKEVEMAQAKQKKKKKKKKTDRTYPKF
ncbi:NAD(P)H-binding protein [filamentous cyanobacterium LEGE 11480]|uniref:NAD(P)H-binding protein n=1 Tax=Romeriopsis navalis LEGE 11480 TaxID=2777977 RepID=A0A928VRA8_9CYAN|nr:NAD(P)H-binding protein [Romeriopsis navalis]MBE9032307.1 NAD(P)H-binding protein [Romeriopsis navalis LEGE 11480]